MHSHSFAILLLCSIFQLVTGVRGFRLRTPGIYRKALEPGSQGPPPADMQGHVRSVQMSLMKLTTRTASCEELRV